MKMANISEDAHAKLKKLKAYLVENNIADTLDRVLVHAGYNNDFFSRLDAVIVERNAKQVVS